MGMGIGTYICCLAFVKTLYVVSHPAQIDVIHYGIAAFHDVGLGFVRCCSCKPVAPQPPQFHFESCCMNKMNKHIMSMLTFKGDFT